MFLRLLSQRKFQLMLVNLVLAPSVMAALNLPTDQAAIKELLNQNLSSQNGVYIEAILVGFAKLAEGSRRLLTDPNNSVTATRCLLEGIAQLTACALKERNGKDNEQVLLQVQALVQDAQGKIARLAQDCANLNTKIPHRPVCPASMRDSRTLASVSMLTTAQRQGSGGDLIADSVTDDAAVADPTDDDAPASSSSATGMDKDNERLLVAGLTQIFYNMFCMLISPNDIGLYLKNVFAGLFKVLAAVIANGKIDQDDLESIGSALGSIFNLRSYDLERAHTLAPKLRAANSTLQALEVQEVSTGLSLICQSFLALITDPQHALQHLRHLCQGLICLFLAMFVDAKVDEQTATVLAEVVGENIS